MGYTVYQAYLHVTAPEVEFTSRCRSLYAAWMGTTEWATYGTIQDMDFVIFGCKSPLDLLEPINLRAHQLEK